jgi:hypothetical protein
MNLKENLIQDTKSEHVITEIEQGTHNTETHL